MINKETLELFKPIQAVIVYRRGREDYYLQTHNIVDNKYMEGKPFHRDQMKELATALSNKGTDVTESRGLLPDKVLYYQPSIAGTKIIWYVPRGRHHLKFKTAIKIPTGNYMLPGLIFAVDDTKLTVFAFKGTGKPKPVTKIYHAPMFNINSGGVVCMGTTAESTKKRYLDEEMDRWERRFFGSNFTHSPNQIKKGYTMGKLYKTLASSRTFPEGCLVQSDYKTFERFASNFIKKGGGAW